MATRAPQIHEMSVNETVNVALDALGKLDAGETFTGALTVTEVTTSDLTITNKAVNTAALSVNGVDVPIGGAIQFTVDASKVGKYIVRFVCGTSAGQTRDGEVVIVVR